MKLFRTLLEAVAVFVNAAGEDHGDIIRTFCLDVDCHDALPIWRRRLFFTVCVVAVKQRLPTHEFYSLWALPRRSSTASLSRARYTSTLYIPSRPRSAPPRLRPNEDANGLRLVATAQSISPSTQRTRLATTRNCSSRLQCRRLFSIG